MKIHLQNRVFGRFRCAVVAALCLAGAPLWAADKLRLERLDLKKSPTLRMYLSYVDADGRVVSGRGKEDFKLILDSAEQGSAMASQAFEQAQEPINVVVVVQISGAMNDVLEEAKRGIRALADSLDPKSKSKMAILGYSAEIKRVAELGSPADAEAAANGLAVDNEGVEVHMLDAVRTATDLLNAAPKNERKLIVLFSDGIDVHMERRSFATVGQRAREAGIVVDTIGYAPFEPGKLRNLGELAKQSLGSDRPCRSTSEVTAQFQNIVDEIKKAYILTFEIALKGGDGKDHTFQVIVDSGGRTAYSNNIIDKIPEATHPIVKKVMAKRRWWLWILGGLSGIGLLFLILWLIFREKEPKYEPLEAPSIQDAGPQRTMAFEIGGGGKLPVVGWMVATTGKQLHQTFKFKPVKSVIGTSSDCDIIIDDQYMSTRHCEVRVEPNGIYKIVDLGSTNGIVVNEQKVREHDLVDGDRFRLGRTDFTFKSIT